MKIREIILSLVVVLSGCAVGQYHLGYHNIGTDEYFYGAVGNKYVKDLETFEISCIEKVVTYKFDELYDNFAPKLKKALSVEQLKDLNTNLRTAYGYSGKYERLLLVPQKSMLDEGVGKDAFKFYDFVGAHYLLDGKFKAVIKLYMYRIENEIKIIGFEIMDYEENPKGKNNPIIKHIHPEALDNANMRNRYYQRVQ